MIETLVLNEELSKKLKADGYPQNSIFGWIAGCVMKFPETTIIECSAPLAEEMLEQLKDHLDVISWDERLKQWVVEVGLIEHEDGEQQRPIFRHEKIVVALAECWLWHKSEGWI